MRPAFYDNPEYKRKQSESTKKFWQAGLFNFKSKPLLIKTCNNQNCQLRFQIKPSNPKRYCGRSCSITVNNQTKEPLQKDELEKLYLSGLSMRDIANQKHISVHKISYWMGKYKIARRSLSEAIYLKNHPNGDPFKFTLPSTSQGIKLLGLGLGLYWGEGNKANKTMIRLGNTDPELIKTFIRFLMEIFNIKKNDLRFQLQIFTDIPLSIAMDYWISQLDVRREQFYKTVITQSGSLGTYRKKSQYGVLTVYYLNKKLRDLLVGMLSK